MELPLALLILGVTWFVAGTYVLHLRPHPRYWALTAYVAAVLGGLWVAWLLQRGHRVLVGVGLAGMIISHVLLVEMNDSSIVHARWLADYVKQGGQVVHIAANRWIKDKTYFTVLRGTDDRVRPLPDENAQRILVIEGDDVPSPIRDAPREWCKIWERHSRTTWLGQLLDLVGVLDRLPEKFRRPLIAPEANVAVYERKVCGS